MILPQKSWALKDIEKKEKISKEDERNQDSKQEVSRLTCWREIKVAKEASKKNNEEYAAQGMVLQKRFEENKSLSKSKDYLDRENESLLKELESAEMQLKKIKKQACFGVYVENINKV